MGFNIQILKIHKKKKRKLKKIWILYGLCMEIDDEKSFSHVFLFVSRNELETKQFHYSICVWSGSTAEDCS